MHVIAGAIPLRLVNIPIAICVESSRLDVFYSTTNFAAVLGCEGALGSIQFGSMEIHP
jgi:hypothetical protein